MILKDYLTNILIQFQLNKLLMMNYSLNKPLNAQKKLLTEPQKLLMLSKPNLNQRKLQMDALNNTEPLNKIQLTLKLKFHKTKIMNTQQNNQEKEKLKLSKLHKLLTMLTKVTLPILKISSKVSGQVNQVSFNQPDMLIKCSWKLPKLKKSSSQFQYLLLSLKFHLDNQKLTMVYQKESKNY